MEELLDRCSRLKSGYDTGEIWYKAIFTASLTSMALVFSNMKVKLK